VPEVKQLVIGPTEGRAITQAVSRCLLIAAARVRARVWSCGICGDKVALRQVLSEYFGFPCQ
jgi:ribosomal protein L37AE/L43A